MSCDGLEAAFQIWSFLCQQGKMPGHLSQIRIPNRGAQCIDMEILISKNVNIDIDIDIDKMTFE